jgi:PKD repeat protein
MKPISVRVCLLALPVVLSILSASPAPAQTCDRSGCGRASCATPAAPVPSDRWGGLRPLDTSLATCSNLGPPFCRDSTTFDEFTQAYSGFPWFMSIDAENNTLFVALSHGLQLWDASGLFPEPISQLSFTAFPLWSSNPEVKWPLQDVDAPAGVDDLVAVAGQAGIGIAIIDLTNKSEPEVLYQNYEKEGNQVYAATLGGRRYAFLAASSGLPSGGLYAFDMTQAKLYDRCAEFIPAVGAPVECPGVYQGRIGSKVSVTDVDGVDRFVVASFGSSQGFEIWDVAAPSLPQLKLSGLGDRRVNGVALWKEGSSYYLAARTSVFEAGPGRVVHRTAIYDVSCITGSCAGLGAPLSAGEYDGGGINEYLTFSRSDGIPFLYLGSDDRCSGGTQREWLLDVRNPAAPQDISPFNYWGWYYRGGPTGFNTVMPRSGKFVGSTFYRTALSLFDFHQRTGLTGGGSAIDISGPASAQVGQARTFTASATNCAPSTNGWTWTVDDGSIAGSASGATISVSWPTSGTKPISARNSACGSALGVRAVTVSGAGELTANFTFSPPTPQPGQAILFDASASSGGPSQYSWEFGDGTIGLGQVVSHSYDQQGSRTVRLTVSRPGFGPGCVSGTCFASTTRVVPVLAQGPPPPNASFQTSAPCVTMFGFDECKAEPGAQVSFTADATGAVTYLWEFGDGGTATSRSVTHSWFQQGTYPVTLTVSNGQASDTRSKTFVIGVPGPDPEPTLQTLLLPWIAKTTGALVQSSDLYVHNPGALPLDVALEFRKRGAPEPNPPRAIRTIGPGATLFFADVLRDLFNRQNASGFLLVKPENGDAEPVVISVNTTFQGSLRFGQTVPAVKLGETVPAVQNLVGLNNTAERLSYFGVTNPNPGPTTYRLRFFNATGQEIGHSDDLVVSAFGQRQFQSQEIVNDFGVAGSDYRVQVETLSGGPLYPYGSNLRIATSDPSFVVSQVPDVARAYLVGTLGAPGLFGSLWRTDAVLANPSTQPLPLDLTFTNIGNNASTTAPVRLTLQPGETRRLTDVLNSQWGITNGIGVITVIGRGPLAELPIVQGESYDNSNPARRFGQSMDGSASLKLASAGQGQYLTGLRQDASYRTTLWVFNPAGLPSTYDLVYRALDGSVLGRLDGLTAPPGKSRQIGPGQHPIPAAGVQGGFTVQVLVRSGKLLAAGQVINNATNDPAYVQGETR